MKPPKDPIDYNLPDRETLADSDVGSLGLAILTLTREIWVLTDRMHVMEAVLSKHNLDIREDIKRFQPDENMTSELRQESAALTKRILNALSKG